MTPLLAKILTSANLMMTDLLPVFAAAFAAGLIGSAHCLGMCAGISGLFAVGANVASLRAQIPLALAYNSGRIVSYCVLGGLTGGAGFLLAASLPALAAPVRIVSGLLIVLIGLQVAFGLRLLAPIEAVGARVWERLAPLAQRLIPTTSMPRALGLGLVWGWLPCGLVYSAVLIAAGTSSASSGALVMLAFGLGTLPAMLLSGISAARLAAFTARHKLGAGLLIVALGLATLAMPVFGLLDSGAHGSHSMH